jgi:hypothetical protein
MALVVCAILSGCSQPASVPPQLKVDEVSVAEIQEGIERHLEARTKADGGYFRISFEGQELNLKLVRVHTEYLSHLGQDRHFACVDLVDTKGDVYDVDFFLSGKPGGMQVTETSVHKLNGQPFYAWEQRPDETWNRVPVEGATEALLGVVRDRDLFEFVYRATLPKLEAAARMWIPVARSDPSQTVSIRSMSVPGTHRILDEKTHGNRVMLVELRPEDGGRTVEIRYHVERLERAAYEEPETDPGRYLAPERFVPADGSFLKTAEETTRGRKGDLVRARALYDHVIERMRYAKAGEGWGKGDAIYACGAGGGNCTDYHAYFIALCRSLRIPARFAIGAAVPSDRNEGGVDGYHCWAEFFAEGKWWPVDVSEADKYTSLATYYFGHHPANRIEFSRGRDLSVDPGPVSGPINFLAYPLLEVNGIPAKTKIEFSFRRAEARKVALLLSGDSHRLFHRESCFLGGRPGLPRVRARSRVFSTRWRKAGLPTGRPTHPSRLKLARAASSSS